MSIPDLSWNDDGLPALDSGSWAQDKYRLLSLYLHIFSKGMYRKWDKRVYIDLYSGPGVVKVKKSGKCLKGSPLLSLSVQRPFDKYIFCEANDSYLEALKERVSKNYGHCDSSFIEGDCNKCLQEIIREIPPYSKKQTVLSFCFVDPFSLELHFDTIKSLATRYVDFLILLALDMDARRNIANYFKVSNKKIDRFLGNSDWRERWLVFMQTDNSFQRFLAGEFEKQMLGIGYLKHPEGKNTKHILTHDESLPLYHLAYFSRHLRGYQYWDECLSYSTDQQDFGF